MKEPFKHWHHSPLHSFAPNTIYMVTASTLNKEPFFEGDQKLRLLQNTLFDVLEAYGWLVQAWAVFSNHYHFIGKSPEDARALRPMIQRLHSESARKVNAHDGVQGRQIWFQYWDTCLTYEKSYYARLNYVHNNPVKHGLVPAADQYPYCSAAWFQASAEPGFRRKVASFGYDRVRVVDEF